MIKAIETIYNGYRFRSRLEARWAVFFDALGIKYEYEKEGYDLDGTWYLPDFYIPAWDAYVEIKPGHMDAHIHIKEEYDAYLKELINIAFKCDQLSRVTDSFVLLIQGNPWLKEYSVSFNYRDQDIPPEVGMQFAICRRCSGLCLVDNEGSWLNLHESTPDCYWCDKCPYPEHSRLIAAYTAARQARFEFDARDNHPLRNKEAKEAIAFAKDIQLLDSWVKP